MSKLSFSFFVCNLICLFLSAQEKIDPNVVSRIREEGLSHSEVGSIAHYLTDVSGPRLTNSPGYRRAAGWVVSTLREWGLANAVQEPWGTFGSGWEIKRNYVAMVSPYYHSLIAYPFAWTSGTKGLIKGSVVELTSYDSASIEKLGNIKGKIVLVADRIKKLPAVHSEGRYRYGDSDLVKMKNTFWVTRKEMEMYLQMEKNKEVLDSMLNDKKPAAILKKDYGGQNGTVYADSYESFRLAVPASIPEVILSTEDVYKIQRLIEGGSPVELEMDLQTKFYRDDLKGYNVVAEIPGTDPQLKDELVILGGHLDSWYSATGATDNAAGCAVMMEAMRILNKLKLQPKRTIRLVLWGGEEQGLIGSFNYVKNHFGDPNNMELKPDHAKVSVYLNLDNGSGRIRGIYAQENEAVKPVFENWLEPFHDLGATTVSMSLTGSTDHVSFDEVGIPAFQFIQDPVDYLHFHHSNMDTYDHLQTEDLSQAATIIAAFAYQASVRTEKLPRKPLPTPHKFVFDGF